MRCWIIFTVLLFSLAEGYSGEKVPAPSHLMVGVGIFDVDKTHLRPLIQLEYRWDVWSSKYFHVRPLLAYFITTDKNMFLCGGIAFDLFFGRKIVFTPSFAPGLYYHGNGKNLGFPINFRSAGELSYVFHNQGRLGAQFNHISNARMFWRNPGADSLVIFYAIPFPRKERK
jgi:lipid A 3-O-deacylase